MPIFPGLSPALQLPDSGSDTGAGRGILRRGTLLLLTLHQASVGAASPHCLPSGSSSKEKNSFGAGGVRLCVLCRRISKKHVKFHLSPGLYMLGFAVHMNFVAF